MRDTIAAIASIVTGWGHSLLDLLYPPRCLVCRRLGTWLCDDCISRLPAISGPTCCRCGVPLNHTGLCARCTQAPLRIDKIDSVLLFQGPVRTAIHRLKYRNGRTLSEPLGAVMAGWWVENRPKTDVVVPVPLHPQRLRERGYNQAALLAHQLGRRVGAPVNESLLSRTRATRSQMSLDATARRQNVRDAFRCPDGRAVGQHVLLIDDVCTTGATLEACADGLCAAGAASVRALTLARAL